MNYHELDKQATPGPFFNDKEEPAYMCSEHKPIVGYCRADRAEMRDGRLCGEKVARSDARLFVHCRNNFDKALEALKKEHFERVSPSDLSHKLGRCHTCKVIAELENVK